MIDPKYRFLSSANADLDEIWESIAQDNIDAADRILEAIYRHVEILSEFPRAGHARPDLVSRRPLLFSSIEGYLIIYQLSDAQIIVVAVLHGARDIPSILARRKSKR